MESKDVIRISVRNLVELVMKSGDISSGFMGSSRMAEGTRAHQVVQKSGGEGYTSEVPVSYSFKRDGINLEVTGRIDGIIHDGETIVIDEIKSTLDNLENIDEDYNPLHLAQAKCYAYIYSILNTIETIEVRLTYYSIDSGETKSFQNKYGIDELEIFFFSLVDIYVKWANILVRWENTRDESIRKLEFPFASYRNGQRKMAVAVYRTIREKGKLFVQAPTGTGKTIAAIFPAVKALGEGLSSKIFYLTAKTITRTAAEKALDNMRHWGLRIKTLTITAKEKVCFNPGCGCNPEECEYAKGYYDRIDKAIEDIFNVDHYSREVIEEYARIHRICPFEFCLDLSIFCDLIICDYNYAFDPRVYLKRFFIDGGDYTFLIDEAHNLVDRSREMFSAELFKKKVMEMKRAIKNDSVAVAKSLGEVNKYFIRLRKIFDEEDKRSIVTKVPPEEIYPLLKEFVKVSEEWLQKNIATQNRENLLDLYFETMNFLKTSECFDERYVTYCEKYGSDIRLKLFCLDPSFLLGEALKRGASTVFFSATLSPVDYFIDILGGDEKSFTLKLQSPFPRENLCLLIDNSISTRYSMREMTYDSVTSGISSLVGGKTGNYLIYFPSYKYMNEVYNRFCEKNPGITTICQKPGMSEAEKEEFLCQFIEGRIDTLVGFAVMGGMFGEGIDLTGDKLCGAVVVGVGLPQVCLERDIICSYFQEKKDSGFEYAYIYPGMNRVMQAVGRVIRTENDRGAVLLIDERFSNYAYKRLFPEEWHPIWVRNSTFIENAVAKFWNNE